VYGGQQQDRGVRLEAVEDLKTEKQGSVALAPRPPQPQDNWLEFIAGGAAAGFTNAAGADLYNDVKAACRTAVARLRDQEPGPDEDSEYVHQLVAEAFIGPCPPGHKLVHLNGYRLDNRRVNLAYVPESDPRPAAPLNPRTPGRIVAPELAQRAAGQTRHAGKKKRKGKRKHRR
jgi:hypothetical protein